MVQRNFFRNFGRISKKLAISLCSLWQKINRNNFSVLSVSSVAKNIGLNFSVAKMIGR